PQRPRVRTSEARPGRATAAGRSLAAARSLPWPSWRPLCPRSAILGSPAVDLDRLMPLDRLRAELNKAGGIFKLLEDCCRAHERIPELRRQAFEPGGDVHRVSDRRVIVACARADVADHGIARMQTDADGDRSFGLARELGIQSRHA